VVNIEQDIIVALKDKLGARIVSDQSQKLGKVSVRVDPDFHRDALMALLEKDETTAISAITGVDLGQTIELMYHLRIKGIIVTVRTMVPKENARIRTMSDLISGANFHEREVADLLGVVFQEHPNPDRLVLPDSWPSGLYPLRKDADLTNVKHRIDDVATSQDKSQSEGTQVNIVLGPQHPALIEPEKFSLRVEGEIVKEVTPRIGYVHRGVEKAAEKRTYLQDIFLVERICGICNSCHATCFCQTVESIMKNEVPPRARYLRTIVLELNRIQSHLLLIGHAGLEIGFEPLFQYMWRDRETAMKIMENLTGNRVMASFMTIGGVRRDIAEDRIPEIKTDLAALRKRMIFYDELLQTDSTIRMRTKDVGVLKKQDALKLCVVGPVARASNIKMDVRKDEPYVAYGEIPFETQTRIDGDSWSRLMVRLDEIKESMNIIEFALDHMPTGPFRVRVQRVVPAGEAIGRVEAPRGELFYYVKSNGTAYPERVKVRTPTFSNIVSFAHIAEGGNIADVPASFVSLDPCFSCTDR
jgi:formate hydrogenlyase subunit 5